MIFYIKKTKVVVNFIFLAIVAFILLCDKTHFASYSFYAVIIHEIGHFFAMWILNQKPNKISFSFNGIGISHNFYNLNYKKEAIILFFGPLFNLIIFLISSFFIDNTNVLQKIMLPNFIIGFFNLMPMSITDGGRILKIILKMKIKNLKKAENMFFLISVLFLTLFIIYGIYILVISKYNFSMLVTVLYLTAMLFKQ
ncbi:MAG: site-2 protease family protein [Oscillospiraceae bacterium]